MVVAPGDMDQPRLGQSAATLAEWQASVDEIYHCGALVNWAKVRAGNKHACMHASESKRSIDSSFSQISFN